MKKRNFIKIILVVFVLMTIILSAFTIISSASTDSIIDSDSSDYTEQQLVAKTVQTIILVIQVTCFISGIALIVAGIVGFVKAKSKLKEQENNLVKKETEIQARKDQVKQKKSRMISFIVISIILFGATYVLQIVNHFAKPVIYIYPEEDGTEVSITLSNPDIITCSYPEYNDGWNVIVDKDGTIREYGSGREYYSLYWEGDIFEKKMNEGFVVKGEDTAEFLEEKLAILGLTDKEAEEFIIYWLPKMEKNNYNLIRFSTMEEINSDSELKITPDPDTLIRIQMQYKPLLFKREIPEQKLEPVERKGYTVVEWGGSRIK